MAGEGKAATSSSNGDKSSSNDLPSKSEMLSYQHYFTALRPWSFSASLTPTVLGTVLSWKESGSVNIILASLAALAILSVHGAGNLVNTYYDYLLGIDNEHSDDQTLVKKYISQDGVVRFGVALYMVGCFSFLLILVLSPSRLDHLAILFFAGLSGSFFYTGSIGLKYHALGDIVIILAFGPISVLFSYMVQCPIFSFHPLVYAIPLVMNTEAILHGNNSRDMTSDRASGVTTLAILLGFKLSYLLYIILLFVPYFILLFMAVRLSVFFILPILSIPMGVELENKFRFNKLETIPQGTAKLNLFLTYRMENGNINEILWSDVEAMRVEGASGSGQNVQEKNESKFVNDNFVDNADYNNYDNDFEDQEDSIHEKFLETVRRIGSVKLDRRTLSPKARGQRRKLAVQEGSMQQNIDIVSSYNKFRGDKKVENKHDTIAMNPNHAKAMLAATERMKTQLPLAMQADIKEEAYAIVQSTAHAYKSLLGKKHQLTVEAFDFFASM
eukprot:gene15168-16727_t